MIKNEFEVFIVTKLDFHKSSFFLIISASVRFFCVMRFYIITFVFGVYQREPKPYLSAIFSGMTDFYIALIFLKTDLNYISTVFYMFNLFYSIPAVTGSACGVSGIVYMGTEMRYLRSIIFTLAFAVSLFLTLFTYLYASSSFQPLLFMILVFYWVDNAMANGRCTVFQAVLVCLDYIFKMVVVSVCIILPWDGQLLPFDESVGLKSAIIFIIATAVHWGLLLIKVGRILRKNKK